MTARSSKPKTAAKPKAKTASKRKPPARKRWDPATPADFEAVDKALERAATRAEKDKPLTAEERAERDAALIAGHIGRGLRLETIASKLGLSPRQASRIVQAYRDRRAQVAFPSSQQILFDCLDALEHEIERASEFADNKEHGDAAKIAAMRLRREMEEDRLQLLMRMGIVRPDVAAQVKNEDLLRRLEAGVTALRAAGVSDDQLAAMRKAMEGVRQQGGEVIELGARAS